MQVEGNDQMVTVLVSPKHTDAIVLQQVLKGQTKHNLKVECLRSKMVEVHCKNHTRDA